MSEWKKVPLDKMGVISRGKSKHRPRNDARLFGGKYPFIQTGDIGAAGLYVQNYSQTYNEEGLAQSKLWAKDTLCITIAANIADTALLAFPACFPDSIMGFVPYENVSNVKFVKYCFDILKKDCQQISQGTAQDNLSWKKLSTILFPCPPIEVQNRIVDILSRYDSLIENYQKQIKLLEEAAQRLYKEWFVDLRFPGHEITKIVDGVPKGWEKTTLDGICSLSKTVIPLPEMKKGYPYIGLEHMPRKNFCLSEWGKTEEISSNKYEYKEDDILFGKIRPYFHKVGFTINNGYASTDTFIMRPKIGLWALLLMTVFSEKFVSYTSQTCKEGAKMPRADWNQMRDYPILIAKDNIQKEFERRCKKIINTIKSNALQIRLLTEARDRLLPRLMSAEIEI